jgi:hypothetical protein
VGASQWPGSVTLTPLLATATLRLITTIRAGQKLGTQRAVYAGQLHTCCHSHTMQQRVAWKEQEQLPCTHELPATCCITLHTYGYHQTLLHT